MVFLKEVVFTNLIDGFSSAEYLIVFNAIIYGFITSYYFSGWGFMIQARKEITFCTEHLAWTIFTFLSLLTNWYGTWHRVEFINNSIGYFFLSLVPPLTYFFMTVLLFPREKEEVDYGAYLTQNKRILFGIFTINLLMSIVNGILYEENDLIDRQNLIRVAGVILASTGFIFNNRFIQIFILTLGFIMLFVFLFTVPKIS